MSKRRIVRKAQAADPGRDLPKPTPPTGRRIDARLPRVGHCIMVTGRQMAGWLTGDPIVVGDEIIHPIVIKQTGEKSAGVFRVVSVKAVEPDTFVGTVEAIGPLRMEAPNAPAR